MVEQRKACRDQFYNSFITLKKIEPIIQIIAKVTPDNRRKERINITKDRTGATAA
jgi:hypothetical protein